MTTDITELAQSHELRNKVNHRLYGALEFQGTSGEHATVTLSIDECKSIIAALDERLALVDALEKAQQSNTTQREYYEGVIADGSKRIAELESRTVTAAATDVLAERQRQVTAEGWSPKHDDQYKNTELAFAASCYAFHAAAASWDLQDDGIPYDSHPAPKQWPWDPSWWKSTDARRDLVKAGALILAEIERLDRAAGIKWEGE